MGEKEEEKEDDEKEEKEEGEAEEEEYLPSQTIWTISPFWPDVRLLFLVRLKSPTHTLFMGMTVKRWKEGRNGGYQRI